MFQVIFTSDYEIHGNGDGCPNELMVEPTYRLLNLLEKYGAKLTILADVAEILKFREYWQSNGEDKFYYQEIVKQLQYAVERGHDVQLHIHSSYLKSTYKDGAWEQCWEEYNLAGLPFERISSIIRECKSFLEEEIRKVAPAYTCNVFRAANWSMMPSSNIVRALLENGFKIDTSVFKYGKQSGWVSFDYSKAHSELIPWFVEEENVNLKSNDGKLLEVPIYCEQRPFYSFISPIRIVRVIRAFMHRHKDFTPSNGQNGNKEKKESGLLGTMLKSLFKKNPWKLDYNQATGRMLINACRRISKNGYTKHEAIPIVLSGHSKTFVRYNKRTLEPFLRFIVENKKEYQFALFSDIERESFR